MKDQQSGGEFGTGVMIVVWVALVLLFFLGA